MCLLNAMAALKEMCMRDQNSRVIQTLVRDSPTRVTHQSITTDALSSSPRRDVPSSFFHYEFTASTDMDDMKSSEDPLLEPTKKDSIESTGGSGVVLAPLPIPSLSLCTNMPAASISRLLAISPLYKPPARPYSSIKDTFALLRQQIQEDEINWG